MLKPSRGDRGAGRGPIRPGRRLGRFGREEEGGILVFSLFMFVGMLAMAGIAIDFMRFEMTRTQLQATLDRAVLAATSLGNDLDAKDVVLDYFDKAGLKDYIDPADITVVENKASGTLSYRRVSATAEAQIDTLLLKLVNLDTLSAAAAGTAEEGITDLEISLVLDVSGSMGWNASGTNKKKIHLLREAAKDFVYNMQCNQVDDRSSGAACTTEHGKVSITLVPYSEQVLAGGTLLSEYNVTSEHSSSHCVDFAAGDFSSVTLSTMTELQRTGHFDRWSGNDSNGDYPSANSWTCKTEGWREIKPFMDDHTNVFGAIDALGANGNTSIDLGVKWGAALLDPGTRSVVTNLTAKYLPGASDPVIDTVFSGRPFDYSEPYNMKVLVVMSDGQNTNQHYLKDGYRDGPSEVWHYQVPDADGEMVFGGDVYSVFNPDTGKYTYVDSDRDEVKSGWHDTPYGGEPETVCETKTKQVCWWFFCTTQEYQVCEEADLGVPYQMSYPEVWAKFPTDWYRDFSFLSDPVNSHNNSTKNDRLDDICTAAKTKGILVYTIGFDVPKDSNAEVAMRDCASNVNNYFAASGSDLDEVFATIATSINKLRLVQ